MIQPSPKSTLFPYTTLFRSIAERDRLGLGRLLPRLLRHRPLLDRSEEHTSELQSLTKLVCGLLLEKKNDCALAGHLGLRGAELRVFTHSTGLLAAIPGAGGI